MKTTKKPKRKQFRYLTKAEFEQPLLALLELCCSETSLRDLQEDTHRFIRATCCNNHGFTGEDYGEMFFFYERFRKHVSVLHLLMHRHSTWKTTEDSLVYQRKIVGRFFTIHDEDMYKGTTMKFEKLTEEEFRDLGLFMDKFFAFKTLRQWEETLDELIRSVFDNEPYSQYQHDANQIFDYLDKLGEAMFLAYEIRGKEYMLAHHADRFGIKPKKPVDADAAK